MTGEDKKRATLDFGDDLNTPAAPPVDPSAVKAATRAAGFRETPKAPELFPSSPGRPARRTRRKTGRTEAAGRYARSDLCLCRPARDHPCGDDRAGYERPR